MNVAVLIEDLDAVVLAIGDVDVALGSADVDVVGFPEVAGLRSHASPGLDELAVRENFTTRALFDLFREWPSATKMSPLARNGHAGRPVERVRPVPAHAWLADRHQHLAGRD